MIDDIFDVTKLNWGSRLERKDLASNKTTYMKPVGLERSREITEELLQDARLQLEAFALFGKLYCSQA